MNAALRIRTTAILAAFALALTGCFDSASPMTAKFAS